MRSLALLLFVSWAAVSANGLSIPVEDEPTEPVPEACREEVSPLLNTLHTSLHDQRHQVHVQCRGRLHTERDHHRQEKLNLMRSRQHCEQVAGSLSDKTAAAELIQQCDDTVKHLLHDRTFIQATTRIRESCRHLLAEVNVRVHDSTVRLMQVLTHCSRPHACYIYNLVKRSILTNVDQIHSGVTGDVQKICRRPSLTHDLRRSCERFNLTSSILVDSETILPRLLHQSLSTFCAKPFTPLHEEVPTEAQPTSEKIAATTEAIVVEETTPEKVVMTTKSVVKGTPAIDTVRAEEEAATDEHQTGGLPGWNGIFGVGPVLNKLKEVVKSVNSDKQVDLSQLKDYAKNVKNDQQVDLSQMQPHNHKHHHHSHRSLTIGMIAAVGVLCLIVAVLSAALTMTYLRRRRAHRPVPGDREAKMPLTDDDQLNTIKSKGYENPTYVFFEGTEE